MRIRFLRAIIAFSLATGAAWTIAAAPGYASLSATTGGATSVTSTSAILNGVALTLIRTSAWRFQYGTTSGYGAVSAASGIGLGLTAVSATVSHLTPATTYHFCLVVLQGSPFVASDFNTGSDLTFTTARAVKPRAPYGRASLPRHRLTIRRGLVSIPFRCRGRHHVVCKGKVRWAIHSRRGRLVRCGAATLITSAGHRRLLESGVSGACRRLLRKAPRHTLPASLHAELSGTQLLATVVTVVDLTRKGAPKAVLAAGHAAEL